MWVPVRRWIKLSVLGALVLALVGYCSTPAVRDWWVGREACGGVFPDGLLDRIVPDEQRLAEADEQLVGSLGAYRCVVSYAEDDSDEWLLTVSAHTDRDQQELNLRRTFPRGGWSDLRTLPEGLPGFADDFDWVRLFRPCPALGADEEGRPRKMLVTATVARMDDAAASLALRVAVAVADRASEQLGCGAEPLRQPEKGVLDPMEPVSARQAADTACGAVLPKLPKSTKAAESGSATGPVQGCELFVRTEQEKQRSPYLSEEELRNPDIGLRAWYGDWSDRLVRRDGKRLGNTVTARCDGENANFAGWASDESGVADGELRDLVLTFAKDRAARRGCTEVRAVQPG
ncbi:hypothetical protein [Streptomyces sp. KLOTTS4A1]|uniref:hypothetical protein n=1 Tax=Streptomyces sp. KLOTTS4A1 TaxID=3390996 RepID=UPI0039F637F2